MPVTIPAAKPAELPAPQRSNRTVPKVPTPQPTSMNSDSAAPRTPVKGMTRSFGDIPTMHELRSFLLFGSENKYFVLMWETIYLDIDLL
jgi:hypothetical protein